MITTQNSVLSGAPTPQELELINNYTVKPLSADEVYTFGIVLCDNEIDRDFERFDIPALEKLAELFVGKTGIFDHSMSGRDQTARIFSCRIETDESKVTSAGGRHGNKRPLIGVRRVTEHPVAELAAILPTLYVGAGLGSPVLAAD